MPKVRKKLLLWEIHFMSSYYDNDPRMPGIVPVDERFFVLAETYKEAMGKAGPLLDALRAEYKENEVAVNIVSLENLVPARNAENDGRLGYISIKHLREIVLSLECDRKQYRFAVCLMPMEE